MRLLLDTHIYLWFISNNNNLPNHLKLMVSDLNNEVYLSVVSEWEIIVKHQLGKLPLPQPPKTYLPQARQRHGIIALPLDETAVLRLTELPPIHRDPFDRMLICQAVEHNLTLLTVDNTVLSYPIAIFG